MLVSPRMDDLPPDGVDLYMPYVLVGGGSYGDGVITGLPLYC